MFLFRLLYLCLLVKGEVGASGGNRDLLGAHMSVAGGAFRAVERAREAGCNALQIFVKNQHRWQGRTPSEEEIGKFRERYRASGLGYLAAHASYLINLASPQPPLWERSLTALMDEMSRCQRLGVPDLVLHPGAHVGRGEGWGISRVALALNRVHSESDACVNLLLETTAGQGTSLGYRFEHLRDILAGCRHPERVFVCVDTCHIFAAGYSLRQTERYRMTRTALRSTLGFDKLRLFHFNDSKRDLGSRVDRHEHIGKGKIGNSGFARILRDPAFADLAKIIETPKGKTVREDRRNLRVLRSLLQD